MKTDDIFEFLRREREIQELLSRMDRQFFMRYDIDLTELNSFSQEVDRIIFEEARDRFLQKTERSKITDSLSIASDSRRKMLTRNFKDVNEIINAVQLATISPSDSVSNLFRNMLLNHSSINFQEVSNTDLFQLYELTRMIIETIGFLDSFDEVLGEWSHREGVRRFSFLCPDDFVNRHTQLSTISQFITRSSRKPIMFVQGIGGVGKTALIAKAVLEQHERFNSELLLPIYFDFDDNKYRGELAFYIFFEACQQIEAFIQNGKDQFSAKRKEWLEKSRHKSDKILGKVEDTRFSTSVLAKEFSQLLKPFLDRKDRNLLFIFDSLEMPLQVDAFREKLSDLFRALTTVFEKEHSFRCIAISRTKADSLEIKRSLLIELNVTDLDRTGGIEFLSRRLEVNSSLLPEQVFDMVGGNPLNLKIAADLLKKYFKDANKDIKQSDSNYTESLSKALKRSFRSDLDSRLIRERLYNRILDAFDDERVRRIVHPGFILRNIDQRIFNEILQPFLLKSFQESLDFEVFKREILTFESIIAINNEKQVVCLNPEIRKIAVELMLKDKPDECDDICKHAIEFFENVEKEAKSRVDKLRARAEQIYYNLLIGTAGSKIDQIWEPGCLQYISIDDGLPDRGKAWLVIKDDSRAVVPLDWIEQSGIYEQNRLLPRATEHFFKRTELVRMQKYFNEMNPSASVDNCILSCDIELSYLNFESVHRDAKYFIDKKISPRNLFAITTRILKAYLMSGEYDDGANFFREFHQREEVLNIENFNLLRRETVEFFVSSFSLLAFAEPSSNVEVKEEVGKFLESLFLGMPRRDFNKNNDLVFQFLLLKKLNEPDLYVQLLESIGVQSIADDLRWLLERLAKTVSKSGRKTKLPLLESIDKVDFALVRQLCIQLAIPDQRIWSKAIAFATFDQFEQSSDLAVWFHEWFLLQAQEPDEIIYGKLNSPYRQFDVEKASCEPKGDLSNRVVELSRCSGQLQKYVEALTRKQPLKTRTAKLVQLFLPFMENLKRFSYHN